MEEGSLAFVAVDWNGTIVPFFGMDLYPGARECLRRWRARGLLVFIVSRASQAVIAADVARAEVEADGVFGCTDKAPILSDLHAQHGAGLLLGDTAADLRAAAAASVAFAQARLDGEAPLPGARQSFCAWSEAEFLLAGEGPTG
jgi:phosphoglycolate phosphatase-like HAD superfamily hydrolase